VLALLACLGFDETFCAKQQKSINKSPLYELHRINTRGQEVATQKKKKNSRSMKHQDMLFYIREY